MNASHLRQFFVCSNMTERLAAMYPALLQPSGWLWAPMKSADSPLITQTSSKLGNTFRFSESRSDLSCHYTRMPTQPFDVHLL